MDAEEHGRLRASLPMNEKPSRRAVITIIAAATVCASILGWLFFFM